MANGRTVCCKRARKAAGPSDAALSELPLQECTRPLRAHPARIEKARAIEVVGYRTAVIGIGASTRQQCESAGARSGESSQSLQQATAVGHGHILSDGFAHLAKPHSRRPPS